ncbi:L-serine ammonia-lyase, iron-sulfur-dependent, subunit alpha [Vibrio sp. DW001]|uniref:L-cysteine desulfidase family protein n=1 Tax=Vibrio sp. DW001 TaxID=2912315 RepID=UPI0023AF2BFC|nr:L-serine ammonia-lyase, iron-sulfur-dependent, subunit alpha [Vibrio sp. DW001]WED28358.1 L-serine ammonia-lyase, iron-sulfur-dependent, subunit alpha [Vibrio sp. DW001]
MKKELWNDFTAIVKKEVTPALGCTEPVSVALAASIAMDKLSGAPESISVFVSPNIMKNGMGVGIPGTGMVGLAIAAAVGAIAGDATAKLEVLKNITDDDVAKAKQLLDNDNVSVAVADVTNIIYAKVTINNGTNFVSVTIADSHTRVVAIEESGITTYIDTESNLAQEISREDSSAATMQNAKANDIYEYALNAPIGQIEFIEQAFELNNDLSIEGLSGKYGLQIGATFQRNVDKGLLSAGLLTSILSRTSAASDARMDGAMKPAMSNSGSGNQGIAATMPVAVVAEHLNVGREKLIRALMLSHLMAIYIKSYQNKLSALCGATTASMGAVAGMTWLLGGNFEKVSHSICSMIGDISGMICDGAKTSCSMKVSSSASAALKAALMALDNIRVTGNEGIVACDVDESIRNLSVLANGSMTQVDTQILDIMVRK